MRLFWFDFKDHCRGRKPWRVFIVDSIPSVGGEKSGGMAYPDKREVHVRGDLHAERMVEILGHEILHVMCFGTDPGAAELHQQISDDAEEYVAKRVEEAFWPVISSLGAKLPPFPAGFKPKRSRAKKAPK